LVNKECIVNLKSPSAIKRKLKQIKKYLSEPDLVVMENVEELSPGKYGDDSIKRISKLKNFQFDKNRPSWIDAVLKKDTVEDDTSWIKVASEKKNNITWIDTGSLYPSFWTDYPSRYKIISY
jgi:hypothetical protein